MTSLLVHLFFIYTCPAFQISVGKLHVSSCRLFSLYPPVHPRFSTCSTFIIFPCAPVASSIRRGLNKFCPQPRRAQERPKRPQDGPKSPQERQEPPDGRRPASGQAFRAGKATPTRPTSWNKKLAEQVCVTTAGQ